MSKAIEDLRHEHEAILFTLRVLDKMIGLIDEGRPIDSADPAAIVGFLKEFADKCHHGKEEGILFPALEKAGVPREGGPVGVMLREHEAGRARIKAMEAAISGGGGLPAFASGAREYVGLLRAHIEKENEVLFPMAERAIPASELESIYERFEEHERVVIGAGRHEELHAMLDDFDRRYLGGR
jgi:hemerythrin-like domain-containing protein